MSLHVHKPLPGDSHFWPQALVITVAFYGLVIGLGFLPQDHNFELNPSAPPSADDLSASATRTLEVELQPAPEAREPQRTFAPPPPPPSQPEPQPIPAPPQLSTPLPTLPAEPPPIAEAVPTPAPPSFTPPPAPPAPTSETRAPSTSEPAPRKTTTPRQSQTDSPASGRSPDESRNSIGGAIALGSRDFPLPPYPAEAISKRFQGAVILEIRVSAGTIEEVSIQSSSGYAILDHSALRWIKTRWRFPKEVTRSFTQKITFQIKS